MIVLASLGILLFYWSFSFGVLLCATFVAIKDDMDDMDAKKWARVAAMLIASPVMLPVAFVYAARANKKDAL